MPDELIDPTDEELLSNAFEQLRTNYNPTGEEESTTEEESTEESTEEEEESNDEESTEPETIEVAGQKLSLADIEELVRLKTFLDDDTAATIRQSSEAIRQSQQRTATVPTAAFVEPTPPPELDLEDPNVKLLWENQVQMARVLDAQRQQLLIRQNSEITGEVERAVSDWQNKYKLDDKILSTLREEAAKTGIAAAMSTPIDQGGQGKSIYEGINAAMESAFWSNPTLRSQYLLAQEEASKSTKTAQRNKTNKLSALSGRGGSPAKTKAPTQMTKEERQAAVIAELTEAMSR